MKAVVDTNVVAYYLLGTEPFVEEVRQFWRTIGEPCAPSHWEAELANAYDALFVELAAQRSLPLATFDRNVLKTFPTIARRPGSLPSN